MKSRRAWRWWWLLLFVPLPFGPWWATVASLILLLLLAVFLKQASTVVGLDDCAFLSKKFSDGR